jgi:hypothetical protein
MLLWSFILNSRFLMHSSATSPHFSMPWLRSVTDPQIVVWAHAWPPGIVVQWMNYQEIELWLGAALAAEYTCVATETTMTELPGRPGFWERRWKVSWMNMMAG